MMNGPAFQLRARILSALSDPLRLEIIEHLSGRELCVCEILPAFRRSQSTISKHLNILYGAGILDRRTDGKRTLYWVKAIEVFEILKMVDSLALAQITEMAEAGNVLGGSSKSRGLLMRVDPKGKA